MSHHRGFRIPSTLALGCVLLASGWPAHGAEPSPTPAKDAPKADSVARALEEAWPDRPEWLDMYTDILQGSQLGPNDGWFRRAVAQTRFGWEAARAAYDRNSDGRITREEFKGPDADFARLDRDLDRTLSRADFEFSQHALAPSPGMMVFSRLDQDGNGKVTREELDAFFEQADSGDQGFLSLSDLQEAFRSPSAGASDSGGRGGPSKETLVRGLFRQEIGSLQAGPALGEKAPDFTLETQDGSRDVTLSRLVGAKPVVLIFGNVTCGPFRNQAGNLEKLYQRYRDRATFVMVYVREAHPTDGWHMESNDRVGVSLSQPRTY